MDGREIGHERPGMFNPLPSIEAQSVSKHRFQFVHRRRSQWPFVRHRLTLSIPAMMRTYKELHTKRPSRRTALDKATRLIQPGMVNGNTRTAAGAAHDHNQEEDRGHTRAVAHGHSRAQDRARNAPPAGEDACHGLQSRIRTT
jgi:hypothetical protein